MRQRLVLSAPLAVAVVAAVVVLVTGGAVTAALVVLVLGVAVTGLLLQVAQHRALGRQLSRSQRRVGAARQAVDRLERSSETWVRGDEVNALRRQIVAEQRQVREESAELSRQLAAMSTHAERLAAEHRDALARLRSAPEPVAQGNGAGSPPTRAVASHHLIVGEDMFEGLALAGASPSVVLVLDSLTPGQIFAGVHTALLVAASVARGLDRSLRLVVMRQPKVPLAEVVSVVRDHVARAGFPELADQVSVSVPDEPQRHGYHRDDVWVVTYWGTAHALGVAVDAGLVSRDRVVYLVQDFEPGFFPWGTEYALARATYERGYRVIVNSEPLAGFLRHETGLEIPASQVFAPQVDAQRLRRAAASWQPNDEPTRPRVLFYGRPSKPRNLYSLGLAALTTWVCGLPADVRPLVTVAGEDVDAVDLGAHCEVERVGKLSLDDYYDVLTRTDLALALMHSPHPSHLPLELPMAGVPTVTNQVGGHRYEYLHGLRVAEPTPRGLAAALERARVDAAALRVHVPQDLPAELGLPLEIVVEGAVRALGERAEVAR